MAPGENGRSSPVVPSTAATLTPSMKLANATHGSSLPAPESRRCVRRSLPATLGYGSGIRRSSDGALEETPDPPDVTMNNRPWLKSVAVSGRASFFGGDNAGESSTVFELSPDLTCIIGGSMTGKSTFLDGLRVHVNADMPDDDRLAEQVVARGKDRFLGGSPEVQLECPGQDTTATPHEQWPAEFYTQNELQRLVQDAEAVENILARLVPSENAGH